MAPRHRFLCTPDGPSNYHPGVILQYHRQSIANLCLVLGQADLRISVVIPSCLCRSSSCSVVVSSLVWWSTLQHTVRIFSVTLHGRGVERPDHPAHLGSATIRPILEVDEGLHTLGRQQCGNPRFIDTIRGIPKLIHTLSKLSRHTIQLPSSSYVIFGGMNKRSARGNRKYVHMSS